VPIHNVERFHCPRCGFITEDPGEIKWIKEHGEKCPVCRDGKTKLWSITKKEGIEMKYHKS